MTARPALGGRAATAVEVALIIALTVSWTTAVISARRQLDLLPAGTRGFVLAVYETDARLMAGFAVGLAGIVVLAARRWRPLLTFAVVSAVVVLLHARFQLIVRAQVATDLMLAVAAFWAARPARHFGVVAGVALAVTAVGTVPAFEVNRNLDATDLAVILPDLDSASAAAQALVLTGGGLAAAALVRRFEAVAAELAESNEELRLQRAAVAQAAVVGERVRIARELHDVVAHHVTTMTVHAGAARQVIDLDPGAAAEALRNVERGGRSAVGELHRLLGFLRSGDGGEGGDVAGSRDDRSPAPSLRDLDRLVGSLDGHLDCALDVDGDLDAVPTSVDLSAYRIVQEALTNVVKHSTATTAAVAVSARDQEVEVRVRDTGTTRAGPRAGRATAWSACGSGRRFTVDGSRSVPRPAEAGR
ncbi:MAG: histidine kinase [Actinomycetota bacterium]|nr:histidine kinase [Actinomycetota bacterium]